MPKALPSPKTPLRQCFNIGPTIGAELEALGLRTYGDLTKLGWERLIRKYTLRRPERLHPIVCWVLLGSVLNVRYQDMPEELRQKGRDLCAQLKRERGIVKRRKIVEVTPRRP